MKRRKALQLINFSAASVALTPWPGILATKGDRRGILAEIDRLQKESPARPEIRFVKGGPRLYVNGQSVYPLMALSSEMLSTTDSFRAAGINLYNPLLGMRAAWSGPGEYDWTLLDTYLAQILALNPEAYFIPRLQLNTPEWWRDQHPSEIISYGLPYPKKFYNVKKPVGEGGFMRGSGADVYEVSYASESWRRDTGDMVRAYIRHIEDSPLRSRIIGYMPTTGITSEWGYPGSKYLPDYSYPMQKACGITPAPEERLNTTFGLLRDPEKEHDVIRFYECFHNMVADTILYFARIVKEESAGRALCVAFYNYVVENILMVDNGHLAPKKILESPLVDVIVAPYSYMHTNIPGRKRWESDIEDDAGNWLGRTRGVGGDGAYRVPVQSLWRYKKMFIVEMDPNTYLDPEFTSEGGSGKDTVDGTLKILQRDLGQMFVTGVGGWLYDFGPTRRGGIGWYSSPPIVGLIRKFAELGKRRINMDIRSVAETAVLYDTKSFFVTEHWKKQEPYKGLGSYYFDFVNHWFLAAQSHTYHRMAAPMDSLYRFDLTPEDARRYKLIFVPNAFFLTVAEAKTLRQALRNSGATVVWYYAPGFVTPERLDLAQMQSLTGFEFTMLRQPGPMLIRSDLGKGGDAIKLEFGVKKQYYPRFAVTDAKATALGTWSDRQDIAFAKKEQDGWTSVYVGAAPLPVEIVRWLAQHAGVRLWSTMPDNVKASEDAAMLIASSDGERTLTLHKPLADIDGGPAAREHRLQMQFGEVKIFTA